MHYSFPDDLYLLCNIWGCMCSTDSLKSWWYIFNSSNQKYHPSAILSYYPVVLCLRWLYHHILSVASYRSWESWVVVSIINAQSMMYANNWVHYGLRVVFTCLHITPSRYYHYAYLCEGVQNCSNSLANAMLTQWSYCRLAHQAFDITSLSGILCECLRLSSCSQISFANLIKWDMDSTFISIWIWMVLVFIQ